MEKKINILIKEMFKNKRDLNRTYNNMLYAKNELNLKGYKIWDFVSQPYDYLFEGMSKQEYKELQEKTFEVIMPLVEWFREIINN